MRASKFYPTQNEASHMILVGLFGCLISERPRQQLDHISDGSQD